MDEDHRPRIMTGESYSKMLRNEAIRSREDWVTSVVVTIGRRHPPLHRGKSDILGGADSWAGDLKAGEESVASLQPQFIPQLLGVRKRRGLQAAAHNNPSAQGNRQGSCGQPQLRRPSRHHDQLHAKFFSSLTAVILNMR